MVPSMVDTGLRLSVTDVTPCPLPDASTTSLPVTGFCVVPVSSCYFPPNWSFPQVHLQPSPSHVPVPSSTERLGRWVSAVYLREKESPKSEQEVFRRCLKARKCDKYPCTQLVNAGLQLQSTSSDSTSVLLAHFSAYSYDYGRWSSHLKTERKNPNHVALCKSLSKVNDVLDEWLGMSFMLTSASFSSQHPIIKYRLSI